jgi:hypothetical protein
MASLGDLGLPLKRESKAQNVTEQVVDIEGRLRTSTASAERLRALMADARSTGDIVSLEGELAKRETEVESLQGQLRVLSSQVDLLGPDSSTSTTVEATTVVPEPSTTTTSPAQTTTTRVGTTIPRTTVPTTPPTTPPAPTTTVPSTTTTLRDGRVTCNASEVVVTATPERSTYPVGSNVKVTAAALNRGSRECFPYDPRIEFFNAAGASVGGAAVADAFTMGIEGERPPTWDPGETLSLPFAWPQACGAGSSCPAGQYTVVATFGPFRSAPAPFTIA